MELSSCLFEDGLNRECYHIKIDLHDIYMRNWRELAQGKESHHMLHNQMRESERGVMKVKGHRGRGWGCRSFWMKANFFQVAAPLASVNVLPPPASTYQTAPPTHARAYTRSHWRVSESFGHDTQCWMYSFGVYLYVGLPRCLLAVNEEHASQIQRDVGFWKLCLSVTWCQHRFSFEDSFLHCQASSRSRLGMPCNFTVFPV